MASLNLGAAYLRGFPLLKVNFPGKASCTRTVSESLFCQHSHPAQEAHIFHPLQVLQ